MHKIISCTLRGHAPLTPPPPTPLTQNTHTHTYTHTQTYTQTHSHTWVMYTCVGLSTWANSFHSTERFVLYKKYPLLLVSYRQVMKQPSTKLVPLQKSLVISTPPFNLQELSHCVACWGHTWLLLLQDTISGHSYWAFFFNLYFHF